MDRDQIMTMTADEIKQMDDYASNMVKNFIIDNNRNVISDTSKISIIMTAKTNILRAWRYVFSTYIENDNTKFNDKQYVVTYDDYTNEWILDSTSSEGWLLIKKN